MSAAVLICGRLARAPERKIASNGNAYAAATIRVASDNETVWFKALAFNEETRDELLAMQAGESIAVNGALRVAAYLKDGEAKVSLSVLADRILSAKRPRRKATTKPRAAGQHATVKDEQQAEPRARSPLPVHDGVSIPW